jgi:hypothetical protein
MLVFVDFNDFTSLAIIHFFLKRNFVKRIFKSDAFEKFKIKNMQKYKNLC